MSDDMEIDPKVLERIPALHDPTLDFMRHIIEAELKKEVASGNEIVAEQLEPFQHIIDDPNSTPEEISKAYRQRMLVWAQHEHAPQLLINLLRKLDVDQKTEFAD